MIGLVQALFDCSKRDVVVYCYIQIVSFSAGKFAILWSVRVEHSADEWRQCWSFTASCRGNSMQGEIQWLLSGWIWSIIRRGERHNCCRVYITGSCACNFVRSHWPSKTVRKGSHKNHNASHSSNSNLCIASKCLLSFSRTFSSDFHERHGDCYWKCISSSKCSIFTWITCASLHSWE